VGQTYKDPVFGTEVMTVTDHHGVVGFNGERANFSPDDEYFFTGVKPEPCAASAVWLFNGRNGEFIKSIPIEQFDNVRWSYDPQTLVYIRDNQIRGYDLKTDRERVIAEFPEPLGHSRGRVCGGDGHDFDDRGEWILLNHGDRCARMFAYNIRTGEKGPEMTFPKEKSDIDYATITPSGNYILVVFRSVPAGYGGFHLFGDQPEVWGNHAGDRLFIRSNMNMKKGTNGQRYGHDLFFVRIPPRSGGE